MEKQVKCIWCGETMVPTVSRDKNSFAEIKIRKCSQCGNIIAAYLDEQGKKVLEKVRTFLD
jgi:ribosomal protein S27E